MPTTKTRTKEMTALIHTICEKLAKGKSVETIALDVNNPYKHLTSTQAYNVLKNLITGIKYRATATDISKDYEWAVNTYDYAQTETWQNKLRPKVMTKLKSGQSEQSIINWIVRNAADASDDEATQFLRAMQRIQAREQAAEDELREKRTTGRIIGRVIVPENSPARKAPTVKKSVERTRLVL